MSIMNIDSDFKSFRVRGISPEGIRHLRHYWRNGPQNRMFIYSEEEWDGKIKREINNILSQYAEDVVDDNGGGIMVEDKVFDNNREYATYLSREVFRKLRNNDSLRGRPFYETRSWQDRCRGIWTWISFAYMESSLTRRKTSQTYVCGEKCDHDRHVVMTEPDNHIFAPDSGTRWESRTYRHIVHSNVMHRLKFPDIDLPFMTSNENNNNGRIVYSDLMEQIFSRVHFSKNGELMKAMETKYIKNNRILPNAPSHDKNTFGTIRRTLTIKSGCLMPAIQQQYLLSTLNTKQILGLLNNLRDFEEDRFLKQVQ